MTGPHAGWRCVPLSEADLDWVVEAEAALHAFPWTRGNFDDALRAGYSAWALFLGERPAAYAVLMRVLDEAHLLDFSVLKAFQRQGVGQRFLQHLFERARSHGATQMFLEVRPSNAPALALYAGAGFVEIGRRRNYYPAAGAREDALVMRCAL